MANILNMNETPIWFDMVGNFTIDQIGEKTIHIHRTGNEKNRFTVVLTYAAGRYIFKYSINLETDWYWHNPTYYSCLIKLFIKHFKII